jgi:hypothetical protein
MRQASFEISNSPMIAIEVRQLNKKTLIATNFYSDSATGLL